MISALRVTLPLLATIVVACTSSVPAAAPTASAEPTAAPTPEPTQQAIATPASEAPSPRPSASVPEPVVAWEDGSVPIVRSLGLRAMPIDDEVVAAVRGAVSGYLQRLNSWREDQRQWFPASGAFGDAVKEGLTSSATPGVKRKFELGAVAIERYLVKPWGVPALAEVRATIVDRVVEGRGADQTETGRLLLLGARLRVVDGWDGANGSWLNGLELMTETELRNVVRPSLPWFLRLETWLPGSPVEFGFGPGTSPFWAARHEYLQTFDRSKIVSRTFTDLRARIERYETFAEIRDGLATVLVAGTVVTVDASGREQRSPLSRRVIVLVGNWNPEVVDEEISPGVWRSAGQLYAGLKERDRNFA